ncbi:MAG: hypothetical protein IPJ03_09950 [Ignavibacteriales bacterium]|nr:hypothetical protein [Ignavibacteriales bacterium]
MSETTILRPVTYGPGKIIYGPPHQCPSEQIGNILATPVSSWLSLGFSAVAAGVSIYNAFQLHQQKIILQAIEQKINLLNYKIDVLHYKVDYLIKMVESIKADTSHIRNIQSLEIFFDKAIQHFGEIAKRDQISFNQLKGLEGDIQTALNDFLSSNKTKKDIPISNWMIDKSAEVFRFFQIFNLFLIESHNFLCNYDPIETKGYLNINSSNFVLNLNDDDTKQFKELIEHQKLYLKTTIEKQPRLKWLLSFLWEVKQSNFILSISSQLNKDNAQINLPVLDDLLPLINR